MAGAISSAVASRPMPASAVILMASSPIAWRKSAMIAVSVTPGQMQLIRTPDLMAVTERHMVQYWTHSFENP